MIYELEVTMNFSQYNNNPLYKNYGYGCNYNNNNQYRRAAAQITGGPLAPDIRGEIIFEDVPDGTMIYVEVDGLPPYKQAVGENPPVGPFGFHIHENGTCIVGNPSEPFASAGGHWNPTSQPHGNHAGDFPVLFSNDGYARMIFFTNKFRVSQVVGKAVIIHENPDDYRSQPSGASGNRLACGVIQGIM
jgi:Cu-Zn family superoxide dismutase